MSLLSAFLALAVPVSNAQLVTVDPAFPSGSGPDSFVRALAVQPDGRVLAGGGFTNLNGVAQPRFARLNTNGTLDVSFAPQMDSDPRRIVPQEDGHILVVGSFTNVGGVFRPGIARLNSDGSADAAFNPPVLNPPSASYVDGLVTTNGSVVVTGTFTNVGGLPRNRLARLLVDGSVDPGFQSPFARTNVVSILALQPDDKVILAGNFRDVAGTPRDGLVRLNADGSVDLSFQPALGPTNRVTRAILQSDGHLVALVNPVSDTGISIGPQHLIRLNGDGSLDSAFDVQFSFPGLPLAGGIFALMSEADGRILVGGKFLRVNGTPRGGLARIQADGTLDFCFELGLAAESNPLAVAVSPDGGILLAGAFATIQGQRRANLARLTSPIACDPGVIEFAVPTIVTRDDAPRVVVPVVRRGGADREQTVQFATHDGTAIAGQNYDSAAGTLHFAPGERSQSIIVLLRRLGSGGGKTFEIALSAPGGGAEIGPQTNMIVTINDSLSGTAGAPDTNFVAQLDAPVLAILPLADGRAVVAGSFTNVNGQPSPSLARLLADGSRDAGFVRSQPLDGSVLALEIDSSGRLLVGGRFRQVDGVWRPGLARFNSDGSPDPLFAPLASWLTNLAGYSAEIEQMIVMPDGSIIAGGSLPSGDYGSQVVLIKLSPSGDLDAAFATGNPVGVQVGALGALTGGDFFVGGVGLGSSLVRLRTDGTANLNFNPPADRQVAYYDMKLGILPDQRVVVAGSPSITLGMPDQPLMWRLNPDGSADPAFAISDTAPGLGGISSIEKLSVTADGRVLIAGDVSTGSRVKCVRLHADGSLDPSFDQGGGLQGSTPNVPPLVNSLVALPNGGWLIGGDFGGYDGFNQSYLVKILPETLVRPLEFRFAITNLTVSEATGTATLEIIRSGDANREASVTLRSEDGSAAAGQDYVPLDTIVDFAPGEWSKTVAMTILNDSIVENFEQFVVRLTNATTGFVVAEPSIATVQISSDDAGVEFISDSFHGIEEDGFVLVGVRWTGSVSLGTEVTVNIIPETGSTNDLVMTSVIVPWAGLPASTTNWFRIAVVDNGKQEPTRQFRLELVPGSSVIPGLHSNAMLVIDDLDFATSPSRGVAGVVEAIVNSPAGGVYLGGDFTGVHGVPRNHVARLRPDGEVDATFDPGDGPDGNVTALAVQTDGKLLIAGDFMAVSGVPCASVARLNTDGTLDGSFDPGTGPSNTNGTIVASVSGRSFIRVLVAQDDGNVLVGGAFTEFSGLPRRSLARLNSNGIVDVAFAPPFVAEPAQIFPRMSFLDASAIHAIVPFQDGSLVVAGLMYVGSDTNPASVVRLTSLGQLDPAFAKYTASDASHVEWSMIAAQFDGKILAARAGQILGFRVVVGIQTNWAAIRRFNSDGTVDSGFRVENVPHINFYTSEIRQIVVQPDQRILFIAAIRESQLASSPIWAMIGRLLPDGAWDNSFELVSCALPLLQQTGPFWFNLPSPPRPGSLMPPVPTAFLARQPDGVFVLAGAFDSVNGVPRRRITRLELDGAVRGVLQLGITPPFPLQLFVRPEVEVPYVIESSSDLQFWSPWRTNASPWIEWRESIPVSGSIGFFRAHAAD